MRNHRTDAVISDLVEAAVGENGTARTRHVLSEALHGLVRLARMEQLVEMRRDVERSAGSMTATSQRRHTRALMRKIGVDVLAGRGRLQREWQASSDGGQSSHGAENDCGKVPGVENDC
jgi:hypothetical protein